ncbi:protein MET30 [Lodderomyces elongisporus NRRL YB-4239]|uniref:Protein MET30 n=1 Tax=Lodderomyces elongisporus (strain ATCC 11503 / CBS 2605 / JCM 1781 / NBRC 1676 / NRRL YB-4239) TaxID=379508 RepID=A5DVK4_LODEL|nr:protein MET30 [Lodderomyces elongisporus NRRL YB-4239]
MDLNNSCLPEQSSTSSNSLGDLVSTSTAIPSNNNNNNNNNNNMSFNRLLSLPPHSSTKSTIVADSTNVTSHPHESNSYSVNTRSSHIITSISEPAHSVESENEINSAITAAADATTRGLIPGANRDADADADAEAEADVDVEATLLSNNVTPHQDVSVVTPFLVKHISNQNLIPKDNFHTYCYRHNPDILCNKQTDERKMKQIQNKLENLPHRDQQAISHVWSIFSAAPVHHRQLILQGLLTQCCFPQLSFISQEVSSLIKIDFISILPQEISLKILCYLDCNSLCNAAQVSRKWKSLADDDRVWHHMCEQHIDRKCPNCGWGLPLMHMKRAREMTEDDIKPIRRTSEGEAQLSQEVSGNTTQNNNNSNSNNNANTNNADISVNTSQRRRASQSSQDEPLHKKPRSNSSSTTTKPVHSPLLRKRPWKAVYSERFKLEKNWRKGVYSMKSFVGHTDGVTCLQFNRKYLMTGSYDTTIKIWKIETGECVKTLTGHTKGVRSLVFDNQKLITGGLDSTIKVWNYHTGQCIATYRGHDDAVVSVDFSNKSIVSGSADHTVRVWHVDSRTCYTLRGHTDWVNCVKIHPASNTIFSASDDTTIRMWDLTTNQCLKIFGGVENNGHIGQVQCVIPLTYKDQLVEDVSDTEDDQAVGESATTASVSASASTSSSSSSPVPLASTAASTNTTTPAVNYPTHLLTSSLDNTIKLWDVATGKCIRTQFGHIEGVWSIAADTFRIVSGAHDRMVKVWDLQNGKCLHSFGNSSSVSCVGLSDSRFVSGMENGEVKMYCFD